jgi:hypothetical protein
MWPRAGTMTLFDIKKDLVFLYLYPLDPEVDYFETGESLRTGFFLETPSEKLWQEKLSIEKKVL